jgi:hypothetical protein
MRGAALALALAVPLAAAAGESKLTVLFTGDNGGEVSPCG